jgi:hypothetical protein
MGYDVRPLVTMEEKATFLDKAVEKEYLLFLEHDPVNELCTVTKTEKGIRLKEVLKFGDVFGS